MEKDKRHVEPVTGSGDKTKTWAWTKLYGKR